MAAFVPIRIEWRIATPWCPPTMGLHLDGLLAWAMVREAELAGRKFASFDEVYAELPLAKHETPSGWVWKASLVEPRGVKGVERRYMTAKTAADTFAERMTDGRIAGKPLSKIDTVRGPYKNDAFWYTIQHVDGCVAWCVGDLDRIVSLLDLVTNLGKRGRLDHGRIASWEPVPDPEAEALWRRRAMPEPEPGYTPVQGRLRPPYWQGEGGGIVWQPEPM